MLFYAGSETLKCSSSWSRRRCGMWCV